MYKGVEYAGSHPPLVDAATWQQVQNVLASHVNGERTREHPHFLKGSLYCRNCGSRMIITYAKSRSGVHYPYFVCAGRHSKRVKSCKQKSVLIDVVEKQVQQIYDSYSLPPEISKFLEEWVDRNIENEREKYTAELDGLRREKDKLERRQEKLLEAHYNDAIPLNLMKSEQQKITKQLAAIDSEVKAHECAFSAITERLKEALDLMENCGCFYRLAEDNIKRLLNQAIFSKLWVEKDGRVTAEFAEPFRTLVDPVKNEIALYNKEKARGTNVLTDILSVIANRISHFFGHGLNNDFLKSTGDSDTNAHPCRIGGADFLLYIERACEGGANFRNCSQIKIH